MFVINNIHFDLCSFVLKLILARKYINRKEDRIISQDESSYIAEIGKQVEVKDVMNVNERSVSFGLHLNDAETITFTDRLNQVAKEKQSGYLGAKNAIRWALDAAGNTGQYIKYVNMKIDKHQQQIEHIKVLHEKFDREIAMLQSQKLEKINLDKESLEKLDTRTVTGILDQLLLGKRNTKTKLKKLENELVLAEKELEKQESQIEEVRETLKLNMPRGINIVGNSSEISALKTIKEELQNLGKNNDVEKLSNAIDIVISSLDYKY